MGMASFTLSASLKRSASLGDQRPLSRTSCATCVDITLHSFHYSGVSVKFFETMKTGDEDCDATMIGQLLIKLALLVGLVLLILGIIDYIWQKHRHQQSLKMTKQQVKDEFKQMDGDPQLKHRRLQFARQLAQQRVANAVPKADVIVTNPEHLSVALQWDQSTMNAPVVVAMGADHLAMRIRQIAMQHSIPILERKPLARALYARVQVGDEIPFDLYQAVSEVLSFVYRMDGRMPAKSG